MIPLLTNFEGDTLNEIPRINPRFAITDPYAFPIAKSTFPALDANTDTNTSGNVVASDTIVALIIKLGIPVILATYTAASTNQSPPFIISANPTNNQNINVIISINTSLYNKRNITLLYFKIKEKVDGSSTFFFISICILSSRFDVCIFPF